jgi:hypothetical protein
MKLTRGKRNELLDTHLVDKVLENKKLLDDLKKQIDTDGDGKISVKEGIEYGMEMFNGNGLLMIFGIMLSMVLSAGYMLLRGIIDWDTFLLILQIATPSTLVTYILKVIVGRLGTKTSAIMKELGNIKLERDQLFLALELKKAHDKEYK